MLAFGQVDGMPFRIFGDGGQVIDVRSWIAVSKVGSTLALADGRVVSVQPEGRVETRPAGTAGPYETARFSGALAIYTPDDVQAYPFGCA